MIFEAVEKVNEKLQRFVPDLYTDIDASYFLKKTKDKEFLFGFSELDVKKLEDRAKIYGISPKVLEDIRGIAEKSGHFKYWPFILGTYYVDGKRMSMNDINATDLIFIASQLGAPNIIFYALNLPPLSPQWYLSGVLPLRAMYFAARRGWWRHESTHARHHHSMAEYMAIMKEQKNLKHAISKNPRFFTQSRSNTRLEDQLSAMQSSYYRESLSDAGLTIHEAGSEELLTRWQSLKEARGPREKTLATFALGLYFEYAPFKGLQNLLIDFKDKVDEKFPHDPRLRRAVKVGSVASMLALPFYGLVTYAPAAAQQLHDILVQEYKYADIDPERIDSALWRGFAYYFVTVLAAFFSSHRKGILGQKKQKVLEKTGKHLRTREYKFPYTYNPAKSFYRHVKTALYLNKVWGNIPNYRQLQSSSDVDGVISEVDARLRGKMGDNDRTFTINTLGDSLQPYTRAHEYQFPVDIYPKELFLANVYLNLKDLFEKMQ